MEFRQREKNMQERIESLIKGGSNKTNVGSVVIRMRTPAGALFTLNVMHIYIYIYIYIYMYIYIRVATKVRRFENPSLRKIERAFVSLSKVR